MTIAVQTEDTYVVLYGIPWDVYEKFVDALPEHRTRHTYDRGTFELRSVLYDVSWDEYEAVLDAFGEHPFPHTYDRGTLEILMSPLKEHDWIKRILGRMIETMSVAMSIPIQSVGSLTLRRRRVLRGLQPDEGYYVANEPLVRGKLTYDPNVDPPPDLVIEVDVTSKSVERMSVYAAVRGPEIWRYEGQTVTFYALHRGRYKTVTHSLAFPFLEPSDFYRFLNQIGSKDETSIVAAFAKWARRKAKRYNNGNNVSTN